MKFAKHILFVTFLFSTLHPQGTVILLNGTSSAGKSALTAALQKIGDYEKVNIDEDCSDPANDAIMAYIKEKTGIETTIDDYDKVWQSLEEKGTFTKKDEAYLRAKIGTIFIRMLEKVRTLAASGKNVIFDMLIDDTLNFQYCYEKLKNVPVVFVLAYCPFTTLASRVEKRISEADPRLFANIFTQFSNMYKAAQPGDTPILDALTRDDVKKHSEAAKKDVLEDPKNFGSFDEFVTKILRNLSLDENETIQVTPRLKYDVIVNTGINSPQQCAEQITTFIESKQRPTAFEENHEQIGWLDKLKFQFDLFKYKFKKYFGIV